ncbi:imidazolonepropionase [Candidatus Aminicenantes bacterium AC-335-A11]|jgi:imidazolonepropionase|nr:imidazolonepropionase [SCandidatus Aminicenantes bacterium Aminicenantia_JdfR_composite]MCP2597457.1 imidazolonepropionase [Candidatus Aminicenantes bacterium AC-335-G13]MCP2605841.1 imidazolonepropionase [Candidatus Aminicenantes bacterium AC-335-O07]MCP2606388.1 imidazolonepropionase [Candidatus Aminicenantes bacterium AC-708-I09]MCP2618878.1 imidazolonepropionase [Candidatus Aminicenantes bacterium AC-335-A11]
MKIKADFAIINANELVTFKGASKKPLIKEEMENLGIIKNGAVAVKEDRIVAVGTTKDVLDKLEKGFEVIDASGKLVTPGLIDPHVHLIFAGSREDELEAMAVKGIPYLEIKERGGGMPTTLKKTGEASTEELIKKTSKILDIMLIHGTTTIEAKSGYEMTLEGEIRQLEIINFLNKTHPIDLVSTFLAQGIPKEYENRIDELTDEIVEKWIPEIAKRKLAEYCDVFCEKGYFNLDQSKRILEAGRKYGMKLRIHADWLVHSGGAKLGAELGVVSADHLIFTPMEDIEALKKKGTIGVFLPTTPFCYLGVYAKAREIINRGLPVALATDVSAANMCESMQMMMTIAVLQMKMTTEEVLTASTINAAHSIERANEIGSLEEGKKADIVIFDAPNHKFFPYHYGINLAEKVFKNGRLVAERGRRVM